MYCIYIIIVNFPNKFKYALRFSSFYRWEHQIAKKRINLSKFAVVESNRTRTWSQVAGSRAL